MTLEVGQANTHTDTPEVRGGPGGGGGGKEGMYK